jgi:hypothetical protein
MTTTTSYGTWNNHGDRGNVTIGATICDAVSGADSDWREAMEAAGAFDRIEDAYRAAIDAALPEGVWLSGEEFYGPYYAEDKGFSADLLDEDGALDIAGIVESVDLYAIIERFDVPAAVEAVRHVTATADRAASEADRAAGVRAVAVERVVELCGGNQTVAARLLGMSPSRVCRLVNKANGRRGYTPPAGRFTASPGK